MARYFACARRQQTLRAAHLRPSVSQDDGEFYRVLPEGVYEGWDGVHGDAVGSKQGMGLDANRQYPRGYIPEGGQPGAGSNPMHLPEVEAHIKAVTARNNICISLSYHTTVRHRSRHPRRSSRCDFLISEPVAA